MDASTELSLGTEFERELRVRLAEADLTASRAEEAGEHDLADAMRSHADDLRRTASLHALPTQGADEPVVIPLEATA